MSFARLAGIPLASMITALALPAAAQAQQEVPLAGLIGKIIQESTFNSASLNAAGTLVQHQGHFLVGEALELSARQMNVDIGEQLLSFPLGSSSGGFSFTTNSMTGEVSPSSQTFGPAFAERAITLGKGQANVGFAFRSTSFDSFEGVKLDSGGLSFIRQHNDCCSPSLDKTAATNFDPAFERDLLQSNLKLDITSRASVFFATYGVTDRLDVGVALPFVHVDIDASVDGHILRLGSGATSAVHSFANGTDRQTFTETGAADGLGDVSLRAKYHFMRDDTTAMAAFLDLRLPTGDKDNLLGTGATRAEMLFVYSGDYGRVSPHVNVGYTFSKGNSSSAAEAREVDRSTTPGLEDIPFSAVNLEFPDEFNYTFGVNVAAAPRLTVGFDVKGRTLLDVSRFELRDNLYEHRGTGAAIPAASFTSTQELSIASEKSSLNLLLGVIGAKVNIAKTLLLNANVLFPMSDSGLKPKPTLVVGLDYVF